MVEETYFKNINLKLTLSPNIEPSIEINVIKYKIQLIILSDHF